MIEEKKVKAKGGVGFVPYAGMVALAPPVSIYPDGNLVLTKEMYLKQIEEKAKDVVNGELVVAATGDGVSFIEPGDIVSLQSHARLQRIETGDNAERPILFWIIRESEILCKHDK